jgi:hypothetical protein
MASPEIIIGLPDKHEGFQTLARRFRKAVRDARAIMSLQGFCRRKGHELKIVLVLFNDWCLGHEKFR